MTNSTAVKKTPTSSSKAGETKSSTNVKTSPMADLAKKEAAVVPTAETEVKVEDDTPEINEWVVNTTKFTKDTEIHFLPNPKRNGCASWQRYEAYGKAKTFGEYLSLNTGKFQMADARYDVSRKFLQRLEDSIDV